MAGGDNSDWVFVRRKQFRHWNPSWDICSSKGFKEGKFSGRVSSFYFSEIPTNCKASMLSEIFGCIGDIVEVSISPRRNKFSKRFGFARFVGVKDKRLFAVKLDNVLVEGKKIHANIPRFERASIADVKGKGAQGTVTGRNFGHNHIFVHPESKAGWNNDRDSKLLIILSGSITQQFETPITGMDFIK